MLVLSRKVGERVVIDGGITVVVTRVVGNRVTLGIDAPASVHVLRGELAEERPLAVAEAATEVIAEDVAAKQAAPVPPLQVRSVTVPATATSP